jgi:hypothetical protein
MIGGLTVLLIGVWHVFNEHEPALTIPTSAVTIVGAAISGFIAKTFLDVHQTSLIQLNHYFKQPVLNSHILTAQRLMELLEHGDQQDAIKDIIKTVLLLIPAEQAHRSSKTVRADRRSALCRAKNFSASSWTVNFPTSPSSSSSKRRHASNNKPGSYFSDCRITPNTCFSSTASSAQSTKPFRFVSKMNCCSVSDSPR